MTDFNPYREWLDFQGSGAPGDFYEMLGLSPFENDREVIISALDQRTNTVRKIRPGEHIEQWQKLLDELGTVRQWLLNDGQKQQYDAQLRSQQTGNAAASGDGTSTNHSTAQATPAGTNPLPPGVNPMPPGMNPLPPTAPGEADVPTASLGPIPSPSLIPEPTALPEPTIAPVPAATPAQTVTPAQAVANDSSPQIPIASQGMGTPTTTQQPLAPTGYPASGAAYPQQPALPQQPMQPQQPYYGAAGPPPTDPTQFQQTPHQMMPNQMAPTPAPPMTSQQVPMAMPLASGAQSPAMVQPGMIQPGIVQPGMMQPGMVQPAVAQPGTIPANTAYPAAPGYPPAPGVAMDPAMQQPPLPVQLPAEAPPTGIAMGTAVSSAPISDPLSSPPSDSLIGGGSQVQDGGSRTSYASKSRGQAKGSGPMIGIFAAILLIPLAGLAVYVANRSSGDAYPQANANNNSGNTPQNKPQRPSALPQPALGPSSPRNEPKPNDPADVSPTTPNKDAAGPAVPDGPMKPESGATDPAVPVPGENEPDESMPNDGKPNEREPAEVEPPAPPRELSATELANMQRALKAAKTALGDRKLDEAKVQIDVASGIAATPAQKAGTARMKLLHHYVSEFWNAVGESIKGLKGGEHLKINSIDVVVVEATEDSITIHVPGKNLVFEKMDLPAGLATVLAARWLDKSDPVSKVIRGSYLAVEPKADPASARKYLKAAAASGVKDAEILLVLLYGSEADVVAVDPNAPRSRTPAPEPKVGDIPRMIKALSDAKKALGQRNLEFSKGRLELAAKIATSPEHKALIERTKTLHHYVEQFWGAVADSLKDFNDVDELEIGSTRVSVVEASADEITILAAGRSRTFKRMQIPTGLAIVIADRWLNDTDTTSKLIKAAFLIVDPNAEPSSALRLLQEAEVAGADVDELRLTLEDNLDPANPPKAMAVARQGPLPKSAAIIAATGKVKKNFIAKYRGIKTREDRYQLAKTLMDEANSPLSDEAYRYALFNEARNIAAKAHFTQFLMQIIDETVRWFAIDPLATKADALIQTAVRTSGMTAREVTFEILQLIDQAIDADRTDIAVRLARVAIGTARGSRDRDLMKRATGKSEEIQALLREKNNDKKKPKKPKGEPTLE